MFLRTSPSGSLPRFATGSVPSMLGRAVVLPVFVLVLAIRDDGRRIEPARAGSAATVRATATEGPTPAHATVEQPPADRAKHTYPALRCGECHEKMYEEWSISPHARGARSQAYQTLRELSGRDDCDRCHEPLRALGQSEALARAESVTCEACHRIERVDVGERSALQHVEQAHETKYGPRCDARRPYFHRTECRPVFERSELCAACHLLSVETPDGTVLPVHTEYADWLRGPKARRTERCQNCHMPGEVGEPAIGEPERDALPDHSFLGRKGMLRGTALDAVVHARFGEESVAVTVRITNARAGHPLPTGAPRQLLLRVSADDASGAELARAERVFERRLLDGSGRPAAFFEARRAGPDTRVFPRESRRARFELRVAAARSVRVVLFRRVLDPDIAERYSLDPVAAEPVFELELALDPSTRIPAVRTTAYNGARATAPK